MFKIVNIIDRSLVDFVLHDLITWGRKDTATKIPATKPIISIGEDKFKLTNFL